MQASVRLIPQKSAAAAYALDRESANMTYPIAIDRYLYVTTRRFALQKLMFKHFSRYSIVVLQPWIVAIISRSCLSCVRLLPCIHPLSQRERQQANCRLWSQLGSFSATEVPARQSLNAEDALRRAGEMQLDWLLHLDIDEVRDR